MAPRLIKRVYSGGPMASWLVRSSTDLSDPVSSPGASFSKVPDEKFSHPQSREIISNLMITELFYLHILSITRSFLHTRFFSSIHRSVFRYRFTKTGFTGRKRLRGFRETCPWSRTLSCVLGQDSLLSLCLSPPRSMNRVLVKSWGNLKNCGDNDL